MPFGGEQESQYLLFNIGLEPNSELYGGKLICPNHRRKYGPRRHIFNTCVIPGHKGPAKGQRHLSMALCEKLLEGSGLRFQIGDRVCHSCRQKLSNLVSCACRYIVGVTVVLEHIVNE